MEVVPALDVLKYGHPGFGLCAVVSAIQAFVPITSEVPGRKSTGPGPSHFAHVPSVPCRPFCGGRVPLFPDSERKSHTGRICALNAVSSSPLTHARNLPTESNSTSCHPSIAMSHPAPSKPGDLFPGEGLERSEAVATVSRHSSTRTDGKLGATAEPPLGFGVPCPGAYLELLRVSQPRAATDDFIKQPSLSRSRARTSARKL